MSTNSSEHTGHSPSLSREKSVELDARDDVEEEEDETVEEENPQKFSFRAFGVAFLITAIIVAFIFAAVPATVDNNHTLTTLRTGYLYFSLLALFLLLLLSCLFCTYYLGGSRDTWEDPVFTGIRLNFSNITAIIGLFVEFVQVCGFSFHVDAHFTGSEHLVYMMYHYHSHPDNAHSNSIILFVMIIRQHSLE